MFKLSKRLSLLLLAVGLLVTSVAGSTVSAQSQGSGGNGIRISPVRTDLTVSPGETRVVTLTVQNITSGDAEFQAIINDFVAGNNELGQPALILDADKFAPSHSLKRYIADIPNVSIPAQGSKQVKVTISLPADIAAGGYYGAVRFTPADAEGGNQNNVTLSASVGSLILVKVPGDIKENLTLESFDARRDLSPEGSGSSIFMTNKGINAVARFKNTGNVHEQPFGKVVLKRGGKILQTIEINKTDPKGNVLPDSIRRFTAELTKVGVWGRYTVDGNFGYGESGQLVSGSTSFIVIPLIPILIVLGLIAAVVLAFLWLPKAIKRYNAQVVRRANRRK